MKKRVAALLLLASLASGAEIKSPPPPDFVIDAANRAGPITPFSSEADLIKLFGAENVKRGSINMEGETTEGTILFPGTERETLIIWGGNWESPKTVRMTDASAPWITTEGLGIGTALDDVESINGKPFVLASYDFTRNARSMSWEGGTLDPELAFDFGPTAKISSEDAASFGHGMTVMSSNPVIRKLRYVVRGITISW